jgi:hypothetical protein
LSSGDSVTEALVCAENLNPGTSGVTLKSVKGPDLRALVAALRLPSHARLSTCDASGRVVPDVAVRLSSGRWVAPDLPGDGCHIRQDTLSALYAAVGQHIASS